MKLILSVLTGERQGREIALYNDPTLVQMPWLREDEAIEFRLLVPRSYNFAFLEVNNHNIPVTSIEEAEDDELIVLIWKPQKNGRYFEQLFFNYFGISHINVRLESHDGYSDKLVFFQPIQILARLSTAENIEHMFSYLSGIPNKILYSVFSATKKSGGLSYGNMSPEIALERIEYALNKLNEKISVIFNNKISRLVPEYKLLPTSSCDELDDASIGWLLENQSVLEPDENLEKAHILHEGIHYRASSVYRSILVESTDIYENRIIHGFLDCILNEIQQISAHYNSDLDGGRNYSELPDGYISFFAKVAKFKRILFVEQKKKINELVAYIRKIKLLLDSFLPVSKSDTSRPIVTPKVRDNHIYRIVFIEIIKWHQDRSIDWTAYDYIFSIKSAPELFEIYCYFRVSELINSYFYSDFSFSSAGIEYIEEFCDIDGNEVKLEREPEYWVYKHPTRHKENIINSENYTKTERGFHLRSQSGVYSNRRPDIVLHIKNKKGDIKLLILDAKYTTREKAFLDYLPDLTMKYVHGIHQFNRADSVVNSLSILYPAVGVSKKDWSSFHHHDFSILGSFPVQPSLQSIGVELGEERSADSLKTLIFKLLEINGISNEHQN